MPRPGVVGDYERRERVAAPFGDTGWVVFSASGCLENPEIVQKARKNTGTVLNVGASRRIGREKTK